MAWIGNQERARPSVSGPIRQHIAAAIERVAAHRFGLEQVGLNGDRRAVHISGLMDHNSGRSMWSSQTRRGTRETRLIGDHVYRRVLSETGTPGKWDMSIVTCEGFGGSRSAFAYVVRNSIRARTGERAQFAGCAARAYEFDFGAVRGGSDDRAIAIDSYMRRHSAPTMTLLVVLSEGDGRLLALRHETPVMTTCGEKPRRCRPTDGWFDFGIHVPDIEVPPTIQLQTDDPTPNGSKAPDADAQSAD